MKEVDRHVCWNLSCLVFLISRNRNDSQFFQFFFYGMGHYHMGIEFGFTSWVLHMSMLILFSNLWGFVFKEWVGADKLPKRILHAGMACIVFACVLIAWGKYLG